MTNFELLESIMAQSGATIGAVSKAAGFTRETYHNRKNGIGEFTASEIVGITKALRLTNEERDAIFLTGNVTQSNE